MLSVNIHKDFTEYKPKVIGGLSMRTLVCVGVALGFSVLVGVTCTFILHVDIMQANWILWLAAVPPCLFGFYTPHGMPFEKFAPLWWAHEMEEKPIFYVPPTGRGEAKLAAKVKKEVEHEARKASRNRGYERLAKRGNIERWNFGEIPPIG